MGTKKDMIISTYKSTDSIKQTARALKLSHQTVRRVLLEEGLYTSDTSERVLHLADSGMSIQQISQEIGMGEKAVSAYLPYRRHPYFELEKTENAKKISAWRERKKSERKDG